ncbi:MAG: type II secretion system F family protein [Patescibacteria group bacterium]|jgi:type IV pilus assembly protein PilC
MTKYAFKAKDWNGKTIKGELELSNKKEVVDSIKSSGLVPLIVVEKRNGTFEELNKKVLGRANLKKISTFTRQMSTMMTAGLPLTDALSMLKNQTEESSQLYEIIDEALNTVRGGHSLGSALEKYQDVFGEAYVASVNAGEEGGVLEEVLSKLAQGLENENEFQGKVKGAMIYPAIVIVGMIGVAILMMVVVIPKLMTMYEDFGTAELPTATKVLMSVSNTMAKFWFLIPIGIFGLYTVLRTAYENKEMRLKLDTYKFRIPILGDLIKKTIMANTTRTLSMLLSAGISLVEALRIVSKVAGNEQYLGAYLRISERVQKGFGIANSFEETGVFPPIVNQMVETGEATGKLDEVLMKVSDYFSTEAEQSVKSLTAAMEPMIMIVLGIGVAFLVVAVIMPIYNLTSSF